MLEPKKIEEMCRRFEKSLPDPKSELDHSSHFTFLVAVVMSAQTTDKQVNKVVANLFPNYNTPDDFIALGVEGLQEKIKSIGLYKSKAKNIVELSKILKEKFNSEVPKTREGLESLPGVGRKTANVVLNALFNMPTIAVDTHVQRLSGRLDLSDGNNPLKIEADLEKVIPEKYKNRISDWLVLHGRYICKAQKPNCEKCMLNDLCPIAKKA